MVLHRVVLVRVRGSAVQLVKAETAVQMDMRVESSARRLLQEYRVLRLRLRPVRRPLCRSGRCGV